MGWWSRLLQSSYHWKLSLRIAQWLWPPRSRKPYLSHKIHGGVLLTSASRILEFPKLKLSYKIKEGHHKIIIIENKILKRIPRIKISTTKWARKSTQGTLNRASGTRWIRDRCRTSSSWRYSSHPWRNHWWIWIGRKDRSSRCRMMEAKPVPKNFPKHRYHNAMTTVSKKWANTTTPLFNILNRR